LSPCMVVSLSRPRAFVVPAEYGGGPATPQPPRMIPFHQGVL